MTVKEIVRQYLVAHGLDGLAYDECGCRVDDLMPCDTPCDACEVGKLGPCDCGDHDWHIVPVADADSKPAPVGEQIEPIIPDPKDVEMTKALADAARAVVGERKEGG